MNKVIYRPPLTPDRVTTGIQWIERRIDKQGNIIEEYIVEGTKFPCGCFLACVCEDLERWIKETL